MAEVDENMKRIFVKGNQYNVLFTFDSDETNKTNIDIGVKAYQQKNYQLAELIFAHTDAKEIKSI